MHTNDSQAINAALHGDKSGYEALIEKYKKMVYGIAWSHLGDSELSEDAAQETFIKAYTYLGTLREPDRFAGWLARIARNVCGSLSRKARRENAFNKKLAVLESAETEPRVDEGESLTEPLWKSFAELPAQHREALTLFYIQGKSITEASGALGITEQALRTRLHRARTALRIQLEQRLEDMLDSLQPSKNFTHSVLVLLPLSPKGAAGAGAFAVFGKFFAGISFALWISAASTLPVLGLFMLFSKLDEASLKDMPENRPARTLIRQGYMKAVAAMFVTFLIVWLLIPHFQIRTLLQIMSIGYAYMTLRASMVLRVNTSPAAVGGVLAWAGMFIAIAAIGFFGASYLVFPAAILALGIMSHFTTPKTPQRVGYNLFLRSASGGFTNVPEDNQPLGRRLTRTEMRAFARFLGELWMVQDYRFRGGGIALPLHPVRKTASTALGIATSSEVTIALDGTCTVTISAADLKAIRQVTGSGARAAHMEEQACRAIQYALRSFLRGDSEAARNVLSPEAAALVQSPSSTRNNYVKSLVTIFIGVLALVEFLMPTIRGLIIAGAGFLAAMLALAITLYVSRRESRSV